VGAEPRQGGLAGAAARAREARLWDLRVRWARVAGSGLVLREPNVGRQRQPGGVEGSSRWVTGQRTLLALLRKLGYKQTPPYRPLRGRQTAGFLYQPFLSGLFQLKAKPSVADFLWAWQRFCFCYLISKF
jgi:hypothetical protein